VPSYDNAYFRYSLLLREIDNLRSAEDVSKIALVLIKLDGLREVNERFGYLGGDKVLEETAIRVANVARDQDQTFEISGTSFALLIRNPLNESHAILAAQKIAKVAAVPVSIGGKRTRVKARMGISMLPDRAVNAEELLRQCETALGEARNRDESYMVCNSDTLYAQDTVLSTDFDLTNALEQGQMELYYQPKVFLRSGKLAGAEALVRWQSPHDGTVLPSYFMPALENTQGTHALFWFVLNSALRCAADWVERIPDFTVAVNLAPDNLEDPDLAEIIASVLQIWHFPARQLLLEITETTVMHDVGENLAMLNQLKNMGVRTAIDDFGTGYSSMTYLKDLPVDELKIDQSFVKRVETDETNRRIVGSIIQLGQAVGLEVVAEGIENADALKALLAMGCDVGQGYHFARPIPASEFETDWIAKFGSATASHSRSSIQRS
jgi:diguanylate cyclase (GGDEF)-like protein